jgi:enhancer of polycomb-like protein
MTARQTGQRFRQRKLSVKQNLQIVREKDIEASTLDDEAQRNIPRVETGVEKGEEIVSLLFFYFYASPTSLRRNVWQISRDV